MFSLFSLVYYSFKLRIIQELGVIDEQRRFEDLWYLVLVLRIRFLPNKITY